MGILFIIFLPLFILMILECEELAGKVLLKTLKVIFTCVSLVIIYAFSDFFIGVLIFCIFIGLIAFIGNKLGLSEK